MLFILPVTFITMVMSDREEVATVSAGLSSLGRRLAGWVSSSPAPRQVAALDATKDQEAATKTKASLNSPESIRMPEHAPEKKEKEDTAMNAAPANDIDKNKGDNSFFKSISKYMSKGSIHQAVSAVSFNTNKGNTIAALTEEDKMARQKQKDGNDKIDYIILKLNTSRVFNEGSQSYAKEATELGTFGCSIDATVALIRGKS